MSPNQNDAYLSEFALNSVFRLAASLLSMCFFSKSFCIDRRPILDIFGLNRSIYYARIKKERVKAL